jgi:hypothetical protein
MPRSGNPFFPVINLMLVPFGFGMTMIGGTVLIAGDGGEMWWLFVGFLASGLLMLGGAVSNLVRWFGWVRREDAAAARMAAVARTRHADPYAPLPPDVLAHWTYPPGEWRGYATGEVRHRTDEAFYIGVGVVLLGTLVVRWQIGAGWAEAFGVSLVIGILIGGGRWGLARWAHGQNLATPGGDVVITPTAVLMNGRYMVLRDHHFRFVGARVLDERPPILALSIEWPTRSGTVSETYRIPVPAGREAEARAVAEALLRAR